MMGPDLVSPTATQCCIAHNVHFLDGVHFMHSARLPVLHHALKDLGKVRGCGMLDGFHLTCFARG